ncbi:hypothetical protein DNTS_024100, partial [Danionella cerebrum]
GEVRGQGAIVIRPDKLEVAGARARGQVRVIVVRAAESSRAIHLCVIWRQIRAGDGYSSIKQQSGLSPATEPHGQNDDEESQEEGGHRHQRDDQIKRQFGSTLVVSHVFEFRNFSQVIRDQFRDVPLRPDLSAVDTDAEESRIRGFHDLIREPRVLTGVRVHGNHLGDQRTCLCAFGHQLGHEGVPFRRGVQDLRPVVVLVRDEDAHVRVCGGHRTNRGARFVILLDMSSVTVLLKYRRVIVDVSDSQTGALSLASSTVTCMATEPDLGGVPPSTAVRIKLTSFCCSRSNSLFNISSLYFIPFAANKSMQFQRILQHKLLFYSTRRFFATKPFSVDSLRYDSADLRLESLQIIHSRLSFPQGEVRGHGALVIRPDKLEVTGARACGQVRVIVVSAAESSRAIHLCVIWRQIRAGDGYSSIKQQSGLSPATEPHGQDDDEEAKLSEISNESAHVAEREGCPLSLTDTIRFRDVPLRPDLSAVDTDAEESRIRGFHDLIREPRVLTGVRVHGDHLGDQRAPLCTFGHQLSHEGGPFRRGVQDLRPVVVLVRNEDAHGHVTAQRRRAVVSSQHEHRETLQLLVIEGPHGTDFINGLTEDWSIIISIQHSDVYGYRAGSRWSPAVYRSQD